MAVRNFYVSGDVDGRRTELTGGPVNKEGGMYLRITQRDDGSIRTAFTIRSWVRRNDGKLMTTVTNGEGAIVGELVTDR